MSRGNSVWFPWNYSVSLELLGPDRKPLRTTRPNFPNFRTPYPPSGSVVGGGHLKGRTGFAGSVLRQNVLSLARTHDVPPASSTATKPTAIVEGSGTTVVDSIWKLTP